MSSRTSPLLSVRHVLCLYHDNLQLTNETTNRAAICRILAFKLFHENQIFENLSNFVFILRCRSDDDVMLFLNDPDKVRQLQYSTSARMEWNRRVIKEEMDSGIHSPTVGVYSSYLMFRFGLQSVLFTL